MTVLLWLLGVGFGAVAGFIAGVSMTLRMWKQSLSDGDVAS